MLYLILLIVVATLAWRAWSGLHRLWQSIPRSNRDFSWE